MVGDPGKAIAAKLCFQEVSFAKYAIQLLTAFFLSGIIHGLSLPNNVPVVSSWRYAGFFWIHGLCVLVEVAIKDVAGIAAWSRNQRRLLPRWLERIVQSLWVVCVLYFTVPLLGDVLVKIMVAMDVRPVLFSELLKKCE